MRDGDRQQQIVDFIVAHSAEHGFPPSVREIAEAVGLSSPSSAQWHLSALVRAGRLARVEGKQRTIRVVP